MSSAFPARAVHRLSGLLLLLPIVLWIGTGLLFHLKPGWDEAYEALAVPPPGPLPWERVVFSPAALKARGLLDAGPVVLAPHPAGLVAYFGRRGGQPAAADGTSGEPLPPASEEAARAYAGAAIASSRHARSYGQVVSAEPASHRSPLTGAEDPAFLFRTSGGKRVVVDRVTGEVTQDGALNGRIDLLYRAHYLQWTPWKPVNAALVLAACLLALLLAATGLRLAARPPARPGDGTPTRAP
ncbi:MAG: PepSY domain-containing protein [Thermoanaerobaculia bacterium]